MKNTVISACLAICRAMTVVSVVLVALLALPITYDAVMRTVGHPTIWVFEITLYAFIAAGFLANPAAMRSGAHFRVTILHKQFPHLRRALDIFGLLMTLLFSMILTGAGTYFVHYSWSNSILSDSLFEMPLWIPQLALPLGGLGLFLQTLALLVSGEGPGEEEDAAADVVGD